MRPRPGLKPATAQLGQQPLIHSLPPPSLHLKSNKWKSIFSEKWNNGRHISFLQTGPWSSTSRWVTPELWELPTPQLRKERGGGHGSCVMEPDAVVPLQNVRRTSRETFILWDVRRTSSSPGDFLLKSDSWWLSGRKPERLWGMLHCGVGFQSTDLCLLLWTQTFHPNHINH